MLLRTLCITIILGFLCFTHTVLAVPFTFKQTLDDPNQPFNETNFAAPEFFGDAVAVSGNNVLIGAVSGDATVSGQAFLFDAATGNLLHTFDNPNLDNSNNLNVDLIFGNSVAISGDNVLISGGNLLIEEGGSGNFTFTEHVFLFDAAGGNLLHTFNDPNSSGGSGFGSVAISGNNVLIGALGDDTHGENAGQAFLFDATTGNLLQTFNDPNPSENDGFSRDIAISGNKVLIGGGRDDTHGENAGQAFLFDATTGHLLHTFNDPNPGGGFGNTVAISGNNVLIGADYDSTNGINTGQAYLFDATTGDLLRAFNDPNPGEYEDFGSAVAISGDNVLIGARFDDTNGIDAGQAFLFDATTGNLLQTFNNPAPPGESNKFFGNVVAVSDNNVLIGAKRNNIFLPEFGNQVFHFVPEPATWALFALGLFALSYGRKAHG